MRIFQPESLWRWSRRGLLAPVARSPMKMSLADVNPGLSGVGPAKSHSCSFPSKHRMPISQCIFSTSLWLKEAMNGQTGISSGASVARLLLAICIYSCMTMGPKCNSCQACHRNNVHVCLKHKWTLFLCRWVVYALQFSGKHSSILIKQLMLLITCWKGALLMPRRKRTLSHM